MGLLRPVLRTNGTLVRSLFGIFRQFQKAHSRKPGFRLIMFSETQTAIRGAKGRGVENPGGKVSWTPYRRKSLGSCPAYYCDHDFK